MKRQIKSSATTPSNCKSIRASWEDEDDFEAVNDFITEALDNIGLMSEPAGAGSMSVDFILDAETYDEIGKIKSSTLENMARKYMGAEDGLVKFENALKQKFPRK